MDEKPNKTKISRKNFLKQILRLGALAALGGIGGIAVSRSMNKEEVWQIDPELCNQCGRCATECILTPSAVRAVHSFAICGYCDLCSGYFQQGSLHLNTGGENQLCPTGALKRRFVEEPYYEYTVDEEKCIGCALCVTGCGAFGNGSLFLQVRHDLCKDCNDCSIARVCPSNAFVRVPAKKPYLFKQVNNEV